MIGHLSLTDEKTIPMNIVHISTEDTHGGAAIAAYRLYTAIRSFNPNVRMLVRYKQSLNPDVIDVSPLDESIELEEELFSNIIHREWVINNRTAISTTLFSYPFFGYDLSYSILVRNASIIHLHWINYFCSLSSLKKIVGLKKPIVWTLHDQWLLTGGCHYTCGCNEYMHDCIRCPQLVSNELNVPHFFLDKKRKLIKEMNPVLIAPSNWLANIIRKTPVFEGMRVEVIPNSVDTSLYTRIPKETARKRLNLPQNGFYLLFNVQNAFEKRKGMHHLIGALRHCMEDKDFLRKCRDGEIVLLCFGNPDFFVNDLTIPVISLGKIKDESYLPVVYSAADVFLFPSVEDNLPNVIIEAMSCGTPTVSFNTGGIPDMIEHGVNGYIVENVSESEYAKSIIDLTRDPRRCRMMSKTCRTIAETKFSFEVQAKRYLELYRQLMTRYETGTLNPAYSGVFVQNEVLPDASETCDNFSLSGMANDIAGELLLLKEIELMLIKTSAKCDAINRQIETLFILMEEPLTDRATLFRRIKTLKLSLKESETDKKALLEQIHELKLLLMESDASGIILGRKNTTMKKVS